MIKLKRILHEKKRLKYTLGVGKNTVIARRGIVSASHFAPTEDFRVTDGTIFYLGKAS